MTLALPTFTAGMLLSLSLIMAIGPQNAHVLRMGLQRQHLGLTVLVCIVADVILIGIGVLGLAQLGGLSERLHGALVGAGVLFLLAYGTQAWRRFRAPAPQGLSQALPLAQDMPASTAQPSAQPPAISRRQAVVSALAFSWLNPHAWLDTAVLIGTASLAYGQAGPLFGLGAATGSVLWFAVLGVMAFWLGRRLHSLHLWRVLDGLVALMMWGTAALLLSSLV